LQGVLSISTVILISEGNVTYSKTVACQATRSSFQQTNEQLQTSLDHELDNEFSLFDVFLEIEQSHF
jgi:hypothetical protein